MALPEEGMTITCAECNDALAVCIGRYDAMTEYAPACSDCCGHGNEDGHCLPISEWIPWAGKQLAKDEKERDEMDERLAALPTYGKVTAGEGFFIGFGGKEIFFTLTEETAKRWVKFFKDKMGVC